MGKLYIKNFGRNKPKQISVSNVTYSKPQRQISLDQAIKMRQKANEHMTQAKRARTAQSRKRAINSAKRILKALEGLQ